jgi:hypothetical protein
MAGPLSCFCLSVGKWSSCMQAGCSCTVARPVAFFYPTTVTHCTLHLAVFPIVLLRPSRTLGVEVIYLTLLPWARMDECTPLQCVRGCKIYKWSASLVATFDTASGYIVVDITGLSISGVQNREAQGDIVATERNALWPFIRCPEQRSSERYSCDWAERFMILYQVPGSGRCDTTYKQGLSYCHNVLQYGSVDMCRARHQADSAALHTAAYIGAPCRTAGQVRRWVTLNDY